MHFKQQSFFIHLTSLQSQTNSARVPYDSMCQYKIQLETILKSSCGEGSIARGPFEVYGIFTRIFIVSNV